MQDKQSVIEILQSIEARGGSEGFNKNPELFEDVSAQVHASQTEEEWYSELLKNSKATDQEAYAKDLAFLEKRVSLHDDPKIRGLAPLFQVLSNKPDDEGSLNTIHETLKVVSDARKTGQIGRDRVLSFLRGIEHLGGSEGYKKYVDAVPTEGDAKADAASGPVDAKVANLDDSGWENDWARFRTVAAFIVTLIDVYGDGIEAHGLSWGLGLGVGTTWGWLHRAPTRDLVGHTTDVKIESGALGSSQVGAYFTGTEGLVATFVATGTGLGLQLLIGLAGSVSWKSS